jgi:hypothetical protein
MCPIFTREGREEEGREAPLAAGCACLSYLMHQAQAQRGISAPLSGGRATSRLPTLPCRGSLYVEWRRGCHGICGNTSELLTLLECRIIGSAGCHGICGSTSELLAVHKSLGASGIHPEVWPQLHRLSRSIQPILYVLLSRTCCSRSCILYMLQSLLYPETRF